MRMLHNYMYDTHTCHVVTISVLQIVSDSILSVTRVTFSCFSLFSVPPVNQRLRAGFPPKELKPGADPSVPVQLANGERVQVDVVNVQPKEDQATLAAEEAKKGAYARGERGEGERGGDGERGGGGERE